MTSASNAVELGRLRRQRLRVRQQMDAQLQVAGHLRTAAGTSDPAVRSSHLAALVMLAGFDGALELASVQGDELDQAVRSARASEVKTVLRRALTGLTPQPARRSG